MDKGTCMDCDADIEYNVQECPFCGLDNPVALRWFKESYQLEIDSAIEDNDLMLAAKILFQSWYQAGSIHDFYAWGEIHRQLIDIYQEAKMYDRLIYQLCYSATFYEHGSPQDGYDALRISKELGREDLELYCYDEFDGFNMRYYNKGTPENMVNRVKELQQKVQRGELIEFTPPEFGENMWNN